MEEKPNILICGMGNIGHHLKKEIYVNSVINSYCCYDYDKREDWNSSQLRRLQKEKYEIVFICVPTEMKSDGSANVDEVVKSINNFKAETIVLKSAIPVDSLKGKITPQQMKKIVVSPEYWGTTKNCPEPNFLILGGEPEHREKIVQLYNLIKNGYYKYYLTDRRTAELVKYMENCWIAAKVTFCNEFASIAEKLGINYSELRELWLADTRVSPSHTLVYKDQPYYDSHCLNKDIPALLAMCRENSIDAPFMTIVDFINKSLKSPQTSD